MLVHKKPAVGARGFFRACEREARKKAWEREEKGARKKPKRRPRKKKAGICAFLPSPHLTGSPDLEPKAIGQGKNQGF